MKLSSRKELLKESELTLKSIKKSLNEADEYAAFKQLRRDVDVVMDQYKNKKKEFDKTIFTPQVAKKIAEKHFVGKTLKELQPELLDFGGLEDVGIKKVISAQFYYNPGNIKNTLQIGAAFQFENGETSDADEYKLKLYSDGNYSF